MCGTAWLKHDLRQAVLVAQVYEQDTTMVTTAVDPAAEADLAADIDLSQLAACVSSVRVHRV